MTTWNGLKITWQGQPTTRELADFMHATRDALHHDLLRRSYAIIRDWDAADDVVQEVYIALFRDLKQGKNILDVSSWIRRVVTNRAVSHLRREQGLAAVHDESGNMRDEVYPGDEVELRHILNESIQSLPPRQAQAIRLRHWHGLSYCRIARHMGCEPETVRKHCALGLARLRMEFGC